MDNTNITYQLSKALVDLKYVDLNDEIIEDVKYKVLDWLGCTIGAGINNTAAKIMNVFNKTDGCDEATIIGGKKKVRMASAAFANGMNGHVMEYDDVNKPAITHPGAIAVPSALAAAESTNASIEDFILGVVAGYEVMIRVGTAVNPSHYTYWHTTGTCGALAAAAAAGKVKRYDTGNMQKLFGIAGTMASGLVAVFGTDAKLVNAGHACYAGTMASEFIDAGLTGPSDIIDSQKGFAKAFSKENDLSSITEGLGEKLMIDTAFYKIHAACGHIHSAIDGVLAIINEEKPDIEDIQSIQIGTYKTALELTGEFKNSSEQVAKFSMPYCIACAILYGRVTLAEFSKDILEDSKIYEMQKRIKVYEDEECSKLYPVKRMAKVKIIVGNKVFSKKIPLPLGKPSHNFLEEKFMSLATMAIPGKLAEEIKNKVLNLEKIENINELSEELKKI